MKTKRGTSSGTTTYIRRILELKSQGLTVRKIATTVGKSKSQVHRILKMGQAGQTSSGGMGQAPKFEIHDYQVSIPILEKPINWAPNVILNFKKQKFDVIQRNNWKEYFFTYNDCSVHITPYKVLLFPPHIQSKISAEDAKLVADQLVLELIPQLEKMLEIKLSARPSVFITIARQHVAMIQDTVFDTLKKQGFESVKDDKGDIRLTLDRSNGAKHIEGTHKLYAESDINNFEQLIRESLTGKFSLSDMKQAIMTNQKAIVDLMMKTTPSHEEDNNNGKIPEYIN